MSSHTKDFLRKEKHRISQKKWYENNKDYFKKYRQKNKASLKLAQRKWRAANKKKYNQYHKLYNRKVRGQKK